MTSLRRGGSDSARTSRCLLGLVSTVTLLAACSGGPRPGVSRLDIPEISTARLRTHLFELAGDSYEGRGAGYPGERRACDYIARELAAAGEGGEGFVRTFEIAPYAPAEPFGTLTSCDVAAWLEGSDSAARQEIVVVGAHHDGQGMAGQADGGRLPAEDGSTSDTIWNSADDNATSVAVLLEVARVLANGPRPRRSILFLTFGAEEHAFNGSFDYMAHPSFPWERHVAMLNLEKLGRAPGQQLIAAASSTSPDWQVLLTRTNQRTGWSAPKSLRERLIAGSPHVLDVRRAGARLRIELGATWWSGGKPVFNRKTRHAGEFVDVVGHQNQIERQCMGRDQQVVRADRSAFPAEVCPNLGIVPVRVLVQRQNLQACEHLVNALLET